MEITGFNSWRSWSVAVACIIINMISLAPLRLSGLLFVGFIERYNISRESAAYPIAMCYILRCSLGPLIGYLGEVFGCRAIITLGCLLAALGVGGCCFAEEVQYVTVSLGLVYGLGLSLSNSLVPVVLRQHFDKHLASANGLALTGSCLGAFIMSPLYEYFLEGYGTPGALLLTSGIMLNALPAALFLKTPNYKIRGDSKSHLSEFKMVENSSTEKSRLKRSSNLEISNQSECMENQNFTEVELSSDSDVENSVINKKCSQTNFSASPKNYESDNLMPSRDYSLEKDLLNEASAVPKTDLTNSMHQSKNIEKCISLPEEFYKIESFKSEIAFKKVNRYKAAWRSLRVFIDPAYIIILLDHAIIGYVVATIWTIMIDMSRDKGIPRSQEIYFLMFLPVADLFGFLGLGWVTDGGHLTNVSFCSLCFVGLALTCGCLVWSHSFITVFIAILLFGVFGSAIQTGLIPLVHESIKEQEQSMALTSRFLLHGVCSLSIGPVIGYFRGNFGSYDWILYILVIICIISSIITVFIPRIALSMAKKKQNS